MAIQLAKEKGKINSQWATKLKVFEVQQEAALTEIKNKPIEHSEYLKATLTSVECLEADLIKKRGESYGEIWTPTGVLSLFGPGAERSRPSFPKS